MRVFGFYLILTIKSFFSMNVIIQNHGSGPLNRKLCSWHILLVHKRKKSSISYIDGYLRKVNVMYLKTCRHRDKQTYNVLSTLMTRAKQKICQKQISYISSLVTHKISISHQKTKQISYPKFTDYWYVMVDQKLLWYFKIQFGCNLCQILWVHRARTSHSIQTTCISPNIRIEEATGK